MSNSTGIIINRGINVETAEAVKAVAAAAEMNARAILAAAKALVREDVSISDCNFYVSDFNSAPGSRVDVPPIENPEDHDSNLNNDD